MTLPLLQRASSLVEKFAASAVLFKYTDPDGKDFYLPKKMMTTRSPYTGKSFTAKPERVSLSDVSKGLKDDSKAEGGPQKVKAGTLWKYTDDEGGEFYLPEKKMGTMKSPYSGKSFTGKPERDTLSDVGKELKGGPAKTAEGPKQAGELQTKYLLSTLQSSVEALRIFDSELASLEKDAKNVGSVPSAVTKALKLVAKARAFCDPLAASLMEAQSETTKAANREYLRSKEAALLPADPWKVKPEFAFVAQDEEPVDEIVQLEGDQGDQVQEKAAKIASTFLSEGEGHPAMKAIKNQYDQVVKAQKKGKDMDRFNKAVGNGEVNASDSVGQVISEIRGLAREAGLIADQLEKRTKG